MKTWIIILIIVGLLLLSWHAYNFYRRLMLHKLLQEVCMNYGNEFRRHILRSNNWEMSDEGGIGWIKMKPYSFDTKTEYYIRYVGQLPEDEAIRILIRTFLNKVGA